MIEFYVLLRNFCFYPKIFTLLIFHCSVKLRFITFIVGEALTNTAGRVRMHECRQHKRSVAAVLPGEGRERGGDSLLSR